MPRLAAQAGYSPRPRIDKLGVKVGMRVSVLGLDDREFFADLKQREAIVSRGRIAPGSDLVFYAVSERRSLARLRALSAAIQRSGAIWVLWPKGRPALTETHVRAAALEVGLVDVKVAAFSQELSALKLVIPVAKR